jgi:hypothetical protein
MVHRSDSLRPAEGESETPVYPFSVDIAGAPERKYLYGTYFMARISFVLLLSAMLLCFLIVWRSYQSKSRPYFVYWDEGETAFRVLPIIESASEPGDLIRRRAAGDYLEEYFVREYIRNAFEISPMLAENENRWCPCAAASGGSGNIFNLSEKNCFVCSFSDTRVYSSFSADLKPSFVRMAESGVAQKVFITSVARISSRVPEAQMPLVRRLLNFRLPTRYRYSEYRVDFILEDRINGALSGREAMISYVRTRAPAAEPGRYRVDFASYMFHPNPSLAIERYLEKQAAGGKK